MPSNLFFLSQILLYLALVRVFGALALLALGDGPAACGGPAR
jgi:hypothetical protein